MNKEKDNFIPNDRIEKIKELPSLYQRYITDLYNDAIAAAEPGNVDNILVMMDLDIQTLESDEDPEKLAFNDEREIGCVQLVEKIKFFLAEDPSGNTLERWLAGGFNNIFQYKNDEVLFPKDFSSVNVVFAQSATAAAITRREVVRPILVFDDDEQMKKIVSRFSGGESTNGMFVPITGKGSLPEHIPPGYESLARAGLLISKKGRESTIGHEMRHSIDPLVLNRSGFNEILSELFAFATQVHLRRDILQRMLNHSAYAEKNIEYEEEQDRKNDIQGYAKKTYFGIKAKNSEVHSLFVDEALDTFFSDCVNLGVVKALRRLGKAPDLNTYFGKSRSLKLARRTQDFD